MTAASDAIIIRSRQFRSSRTLFFRQSYAASSATASGAIVFGRTPRCAAIAPKQVLDERRHVGQPLAQRRHPQRVDVEAIVEILTEAAGLDLALEIAVGGRDDARRDLRSARSPPTRITFRSSSTRSSLACAGSGSSPTSSRNSVPSPGVFERAAAQAIGAGERAALVAEQLALDELLGQRRAVDGDERRSSRPGPADAARARPAPCRCRSRRR